ncbi:hypothetical protein [Leucothrix arctica]|uniref:Uncharacterized protein n=1 Tax=Leucothrix arctica TaxID=1481894 RepID=A0A317CKJ6_9GAMM|nr:hypothetical protein [Leucothrix arctica]PWQ98691.1 hypothetical protein DKT75_02455 [Leucothrix arctica]
MAEKTLILGPSHIMRWIQGIETGVLKKLEGVDFHGRGGNPIWSDFNKSKEEKFSEYSRIIYIVGDFRFGNKYLTDSSLKRNQFGIDRALINLNNDVTLYNKVMSECTRVLNSEHEEKISFIFWDVALREFNNKLAGNYLSNGCYEHPVWNLLDIENKFSKNVISLVGVDMTNFYIDSSNHPSLQGYFFLYNSIFGERYNYNKAINIKKYLDEENFVFCGDSSFVRNLNKYIDYGIFSGDKIPQVTLSELKSFNNTTSKKIIFISNIRNINSNDEVYLKRCDRLYDIIKGSKGKIRVLLWEAYTQEVIAQRHLSYSKFSPEHKLLGYKSTSKLLSNEDYYLDVTSVEAQSLVDLNVGLQPTIYGVLWGLLFHTQSKKKFIDERLALARVL